jgi:hypothetical protein
MTALTKFVLWRVVALIVIFLIVVYLTNQALAIALLTPPLPKGESYPTALVVKVWAYLIISIVLVVFDVWLLVRTIKQVNRTKS